MKNSIKNFYKRIANWFSPVRIFATILLFVALLVGVLGYISKYTSFSFWDFVIIENLLEDFYANITVDCISIAIAILVIDVLNDNRETKRLKSQLIREVAVPDNGIALRAVEELRVNGWLEEDALKGAYLVKANLENVSLRECNLEKARLSKANLIRADLYKSNFTNADLEDANLMESQLWSAILKNTTLMGTNLQNAQLSYAILDGASGYEANFKGAKVKTEQLFKLKSLCYAIMPDGSYYDGRFNLVDDITSSAEFGYDFLSFQDMSSYYGIDVKTYSEGQKWAVNNNFAKWLKYSKGKFQINLSEKESVEIKGVIRRFIENRILVDEKTFLVTAKSMIDPNLQVGSHVNIEGFNLFNNVYFLKRIESEENTI